MSKSEPTCALSLKLPVALYQQLCEACDAQETTKTALVIAALERQLQEEEK
jgi:hypothetical protein